MSIFSKASNKGFEIVMDNDTADTVIKGLKKDSRIEYNKKNPKRAGSKAASRYDVYSKATTVSQYMELNKDVAGPDFKYDLMRGFVKII